MTKNLLDARALSDIAVKGLQEIKGRNIIRMNLTQADGAVTDYFIICTGTSDRHVDSLAQSVMKELKEHGEHPISKEGLQHGEWVLLDFVNVVVHIFQEDKRDFYKLEKLWGDAVTERFDDDY